MTEPVPTAEFASIVYGREIPLDDPAEAFHEASRLYPNVAPSRAAVLATLASSPELQQTTMRAARTHDHRPGVDLPRIRLPPHRFRDLLHDRRSAPPTARTALRLEDLGCLLGVAYRACLRDGLPRRGVPSAGGLYPLELYALPLSVDGLGPAAFHYHPFRHRLEPLRAVAETDVAAAVVDPSLVERSAVLVVVTTVVWRSRFKYGPRGYRFALLEAGHVGQNVVLAATALEVAAVPVGGFYDRRLDDLVCADGLDEASIYAVCIGGRR